MAEDKNNIPAVRPTPPVWLALLLFAAVLVAYWPSIRGGMLWDDDAHITRPALQSVRGLWRIWFDIGATQQYYPLLHSAFWLEHHFWGDSTTGYRLLNVVLHATASCLFALVLSQLSIRGAWLGAFLFALHPVGVESVAWISEQKNTLSTVFYLLAMLLYLQNDEETNSGSSRLTQKYFIAMSLFVAAILTKSVTATLPAALLVIVWWSRGKLSWERDVVPLAPWFAVSIGAGLVTAWVERRYIGAMGSDFSLSLIERCLIAGRAIIFYLGKLLWPLNLIFIYPRWTVSARVWWQYLYPTAVIALMVSAWLVRRWARGPLAVLLLFTGSLFPALGFFNVYPFVYSFVAGHFQYLASLAFFGWIAAVAHGRWQTPIAIVAIGVLGTLTWFQSAMYRNSETLYRATIVRNPDCWMAYNNLGFVISGEGRVSEAGALYQQALKIKPDYAEAHNNLGAAFYSEGRIADAIEHFEYALHVRPTYPDALNNLGNALLSANRLQEAMTHFEQALRLKPDYAEAKLNLGTALYKANRVSQAVTNFTEAIRLNPNYAEAYDALGVVSYSSGQLADAKTQFEKAVRLKPNYVPARRDLAEALWESGQPDEAISQLEAVLRLSPQDAEALTGLAKLYSARGRFPEAASRYEELLRLNPNDATAHHELALVLESLKRPQDAFAHFQEAIRLRPDYADAHYNLGLLLVSSRRRSDAMAEFKAVLRYNPNHAQAHDALGAALYESGRFAEAVAEFTETLRIKPDLAGVRDNLELARRAAGITR